MSCDSSGQVILSCVRRQDRQAVGKKNIVSHHLLWSLSHFVPSGFCLSSCLNLVSDNQCCGSISQKTTFFLMH